MCRGKKYCQILTYRNDNVHARVYVHAVTKSREGGSMYEATGYTSADDLLHFTFFVTVLLSKVCVYVCSGGGGIA